MYKNLGTFNAGKTVKGIRQKLVNQCEVIFPLKNTTIIITAKQCSTWSQISFIMQK